MVKRTGHAPVSVIRYNETSSSRTELGPKEPLPSVSSDDILWLNVYGEIGHELSQDFRKQFELHSLVVEDLKHEKQRPKFEQYENYFLIVMHMMSLHKDRLQVDQIAMVLGQNMLLSFQEQKGYVFETIRDRIRDQGGKVHQRKADYLLYLLMDTLVKKQGLILNQLEEKADALETDLLGVEHAHQVRKAGTLKKLYLLRTLLSDFKKSVRPLRDMLQELVEVESTLIEPRTQLFFRDVSDRVNLLVDSMENLRETLQSLIDLHMTQVNTRMSEVMKVMAMISTIFMPLNLIAAIYGMNFKHMPELQIQGFYYGVLAAMFLVVIGMLVFFRNKRWL